jgi:flagellar M-ring protein FliF
VATDSSSTRNYELGREVAVTNAAPGKIRRLSVAVALSAEAMAKAKPAEIEQLKQLVSAAVGANPARGDQVAIVMRSFRQTEIIPPKFWETPWFATLVRNGVALLAVLMTLLLGVRPLIKTLRRDGADGAKGKGGKKRKSKSDDDDDDDEDDDDDDEDVGNGNRSARSDRQGQAPSVQPAPALVAAQDSETGVVDAEMLAQQVNLAQQLVQERPDSAVAALRQMLKQPETEGASP